MPGFPAGIDSSSPENYNFFIHNISMIGQEHTTQMKTITHAKITNIAAFVLSSAVLCAVCLSFAIGVYDWHIFLGYFRHPLIFLLNWLPMLALQFVFLCIFNRQWPSFLMTAAVFLTASIGNFFKLKFRDEPFTFQDIGSIKAGLGVAGTYGVALNKRILLAILIVLVLTLVLAFAARRRLGKFIRPAGLVLLAVLGVFSWRWIYADEALYQSLGGQNLIMETWDSNQYFIATGFPYPFIHSIRSSRDIPPEGYDPAEAEALLSQYQDSDIPSDKKISLLVLQLESFTDLEAMGVSGISDDVYTPLHAIEDESIRGMLVANVIGGGTIDTERCLLSGSYGLQSYRKDAASYVRYLADQGYRTSFGHPNRAHFYNRKNVAQYLGFEEALFTDNYYNEVTGGEWRCDSTFLPDCFLQFRQALTGEQPVFHFRVTLQGHAPYNSESYDVDGHFWQSDSASDASRYIVNNYLSMIAETQRYVLDGLNSLRDAPEPAVVLMYGDHNPYLDSGSVYQDLGLSFDLSGEKGFLAYYGTPWLLWANDAAREQLGDIFSGTGPTVSPGYLMNVLFRTLGWEGNAYMQFTDDIMQRLPVISTNGYYLENGRFTVSPDSDSQALLHNYECAQFYLKYNWNTNGD